MKEFLNITKALSDESRVRSLFALKEGELCVCQIIALLELAPSTVSKHLSLLKQANLIESRKMGRWIYYRLTNENVTPLIEGTLTWFFSHTENQKILRNDKARLKEILSMELEDVCKK